MRRLIAGCERCSRWPARVKPPVSAIAMKVRTSSMSMIRNPDADRLNYAFHKD
jgi:hypothetical protein